MGTPTFAEASLRALVEAGIRVVAVVTVADKQQGRGLVSKASPVKEFASHCGIPVLQPTNLKSEEFLAELASYRPDLGIVVAFRMLPEKVWNMPPLGTVNVHGSLLPAYRGAAPINHAIINGETETGVTIFKLKHEIDTGDVLLQRKMGIGPDENAGQLHDRMMILGAEALVEAVAQIRAGQFKVTPQAMMSVSSATAPAAPKIFRENCKINWTQDSGNVHNFVRGLSPHPGAWTMLDGAILKVFKGEKSTFKIDLEPGTIKYDGKSELSVACGDGSYRILELQPEGKKRMTAEEYMRGYRPADGSRFE